MANIFADELRHAATAEPRNGLSAVSQALWTNFAAGKVTEAEAEEIAGIIEVRMVIPAAPTARQRPRGSRPRTDASLERRRRWAASGRLPLSIACRFTQAEQAVLAVVAVETAKRGDCRLFHEQIAAIAGVSRSTVRAALRRARDLGVITIEERRSSAWRNLSSVVRIVSREWQAWNRLARRSPAQRGGDISAATTTTVLGKGRLRPAEAQEEATGRRKAGSTEPRGRPSRFAEAGRTRRSGHARGA